MAEIQPDTGVSFHGVLVGLLELGIAAGRNPGGLFGSTLRHFIRIPKMELETKAGNESKPVTWFCYL
ncbi:MAG: hypothetical protein EBT07_14475 [Actinobacteria bacterium]|nr:hypothetical protein [Actinomycetota bacterium]